MKKNQFFSHLLILGQTSVCSLITIFFSATPVFLCSIDASGKEKPEVKVREHVLESSALSAPVYSGEILRRIHPTNLLKALQVLEPSIVSETMVFYGVQAIGANVGSELPLLILNGHEVHFDRIKDIDILNISSVSVLKDATSTAFYGLKAANGVIIVNTAVSADSKIQVSYDFDGDFQFPQLRGFDMMNSQQKLDFEKSAGLYEGRDELYLERKKSDNNDWLKEAVQTTFSHKHRLALEGRDENLEYRAALRADLREGILSSSNINGYGASAYIGYNNDIFSVSNELTVDIYDNNESTLTDLTGWAKINPYYSPRDVQGLPYKKLGEGSFNAQNSPLFEESLNSGLKSSITKVINNLRLKWKINKSFSLNGLFAIVGDQEKEENFLSPESNIFSPDDIKKGHYGIARNKYMSFQEDLWLAYNYEGERNRVEAELGADMFSGTSTGNSYQGQGISSNNMNYISFAQYYAPGAPYGVGAVDRLLSGNAQIRWTLDNALELNVAGRLDKSSILAPKNKVANSFSGTVAYNFANGLKMNKDWSILNLSASYGHTAGISFLDYSYANPSYVYDYDSPYLDGNGTSEFGKEGLVNLGNKGVYNPSLRWKTQKVLSLAARAQWRSLYLDLRYYNNLIDNLLTLEKLDPIFGDNYTYGNSGSVLNSGFEYSLGYNLKNKDFTLGVFTSGVFNISEIKSISSMEDELYSATNKVGHPASGIYAFESAGIDSNTGQRMYLLNDGTKSFTPSQEDLKLYGSSVPKLRGRLGVYGSWKSLDFTAIFSYAVGGVSYDYYSALMIDNACVEENLPVEAIGKKWTSNNKEGAIYQKSSDSIIPASCFVVKNNSFSLSTLSLSYNLPQSVLSPICSKGISIGLTAYDLFKIRSVKVPTSIAYPDATSLLISLKLKF